MLESPVQAQAFTPRSSTAPFPHSSGNAKWAIMGITVVLVAVLGAIVLLRRPQPAAAVQAVQEPVAAPAARAAAPPEKPADAVDPKSVAVLPFENMSEDKDNAFFTDGVHEDVLTNLSFVKDLHVDLPHFGHAVPQHDKAHQGDRPRTRGGLRAGGQRAPLRQQGAGHGPADRREDGRARLGQGLRPRPERHLCDPGRACPINRLRAPVGPVTPDQGDSFPSAHREHAGLR